MLPKFIRTRKLFPPGVNAAIGLFALASNGMRVGDAEEAAGAPGGGDGGAEA
jgi:hypothetical protein